MPTPTVERDIARAKDFRKLAKDSVDAGAKRIYDAAAGRLERRAAKSAGKVAKPRRPAGPNSVAPSGKSR